MIQFDMSVMDWSDGRMTGGLSPLYMFLIHHIFWLISYFTHDSGVADHIDLFIQL